MNNPFNNHQLPNESIPSSNELNDSLEFFKDHTIGDASQGSEYLDDVIRMVEQPFKALQQKSQG